MKSLAALVICALVLLIGGCATGQGSGEMRSASLDFALIGDMPYDGRQEKEFDNMMKDIDAAEVAFVVHDGDFWWDGGAWTEKAGGLPPCSDEAFDDRLVRADTTAPRLPPPSLAPPCSSFGVAGGRLVASTPPPPPPRPGRRSLAAAG